MKTIQVLGLGSALLDLTYEVSDEFLKELRIVKGEMQLISREKTLELLDKLKNYPVMVSPGGSSSNTIAGIAYLGGKSSFIGKIGNDKNGNIYKEETKKAGVIPYFQIHPTEITGNTFTFITPDFERSFAVYLGASLYFNEEDIIESLVKDCEILHLEGYQLWSNESRKAVNKAVKIAKETGALVSLDLSDSGLVSEHKEEYIDFIKNFVDIVFANESEALALTRKTQEDALLDISRICKIAVVKLGENGSLIRTDEITYKIPGYKTKVVNTNGAGDMYSAGILYGLTNGIELEKAGKLASYAASLVVGKPEARYGSGLKEKIQRFYFVNVL